MARFSLSQLQTSARPDITAVSKSATVRADGGYLVDIAKNPSVNKVGAVTQRLATAGAIPVTNNTKPTNLALLGLNSVGCSLVINSKYNDRNYSVVTTQLDSETIDNPNKFDETQFSQIEKIPISFDNVIKDFNSSFFTLDPSPANESATTKKVPSSQPQVESLPDVYASIIDVNNVPSMPLLRAFIGVG